MTRQTRIDIREAIDAIARRTIASSIVSSSTSERGAALFQFRDIANDRSIYSRRE